MLETKPPNIQVVLLKARWTEESAGRAVRSWMKLATSQSASINLVAAQDDSMAMGARKAFHEIANRSRAFAMAKFAVHRMRWSADDRPGSGYATNCSAATIHIPTAYRTGYGDYRKGPSGWNPAA